MHNKVLPFVVSALLFAVAPNASAQVGQAWTDVGYFNLNVGFETVSGDLNDATTFRLYDEDASLSVAQAIDSGAFFDFSAGARVWRNVSVGLGFHQGSTKSEAAVQGAIPHPLFFNRNRAVATVVSDLGRRENAVHLQFGYMIPLSDRINVHVLLGPSFFKLRQDVVSDVAIAEQGGGFVTVSATPTVTERKESSNGFNIGADVGFKVVEIDRFKIGAGMFIRYAGASANVQVFDERVGGHRVDSDVGGVQVGFGGRLRF